MNYESRMGILDSGVGGLSVYLPLRAALPDADIIYLADSVFAPYGTKSQAELVVRLKTIVRWLIDRSEMKLIVLACNTATVNGLEELRTIFPSTEFVGMEPAIKPAAEVTDRIIVLGTESTVHNPRYRALVERCTDGRAGIARLRSSSYDRAGFRKSWTLAGHSEAEGEGWRSVGGAMGQKIVWHVGANELVAQVEAGRLTDPSILERKLSLPSREAESVVIGCSHFSFLKQTIAKHWPQLQIFDGADGVVRRTLDILGSTPRVEPGNGRSQFLTTGPDRLVRFLHPPIQFRHVEVDQN